MELSKNGDEVSGGLVVSELNVSSEEEEKLKNSGKLFWCEVKSDLLVDDLVVVVENDDKSDNFE